LSLTEKHITVLPGDGIGPEVTNQAVRVLDTIAKKYGYHFHFNFGTIGADAIEKTGDPLPKATLETCLAGDAVLLGAVGHPKFDKDPTLPVRPEMGLLKIRKELGLFANIRPVQTYPSLYHLSPVKSNLLEKVDIVIYRELTSGIYFGEKTNDLTTETASDLCSYSAEEIRRIAKLAFEHAGRRKRKLTLVDKANVLETSRLWRKTVTAMASAYPAVELGFLYVDNAAMQLIINPSQFDVILTENMFGDILSDEASVLSGSLGLLPSASLGTGPALFEPIHGAYPQAAGKDIANPIGTILAAAMMMEHFGLTEAATDIQHAVEWSIQNAFVTKDLDPVNFYFTSTIGEMICDCITNRTDEAVNKGNIQIRKSTII
jgi:3-isopropylmalate dehydrogenase